MRYYINCNYNERNKVKQLGALWDGKKKQWYFINGKNAKKFAKWLPETFDYDAVEISYPTLTEICKDLGMMRICVKEWLIANGYIINSYTLTEKGMDLGIQEETRPNGKIKLTYNEAAQQFIKDNQELIMREYVNIDYENPELSPIEFKKLGLNNTDYLILDTETTGLQKDDEVIELAIIDFTGKEIYHSMYEPQKDVHWAASKVSKLTKKKLIGSPKFMDEWSRIVELIDNKKLIAHNATFDYQLIKQTLERYDLDKNDADKIFVGYIDSMDLAKKYISSSNYKLETLCEKLGIEDEQKHRATYDCLMVLEMLRALEQSEYELIKKNDAGTALSSNAEKKERKKLVEKYAASGLSIDQIAENLFISKGTAENYVFELMKEGKIEHDNFINSDIENNVMNAMILLGKWDGKLKSIKDLLDDSISYFDIKVVLAKNKLI